MWFPSRRLLWLRMYPRGFRQTKEEEGPGWTFPPLIRLLASGKPTHTRTLTWRRKRVIRKENGECWPRRTHNRWDEKTGYDWAHAQPFSFLEFRLSFFFYLSLLYRDFFFCSPLPLSGCFFEGLPPIGREIVQTPAGGTKSGISRGRIETEIFLFSTFNFQWHATSEEKKNKFFSRYLRRDRKWITFLSERKFSDKKKKVECPLADQLSSSPLTKRAPRKRERAKVKKKKKGQGQHLKQDPPLRLEGLSLSLFSLCIWKMMESKWKYKKKIKRRRRPNMAREEMTVFLVSSERRGQVSERSSSSLQIITDCSEKIRNRQIRIFLFICEIR